MWWIWYWMFLNRNAALREIKRLELQIAEVRSWTAAEFTAQPDSAESTASPQLRTLFAPDAVRSGGGSLRTRFGRGVSPARAREARFP